MTKKAASFNAIRNPLGSIANKTRGGINVMPVVSNLPDRVLGILNTPARKSNNPSVTPRKEVTNAMLVNAFMLNDTQGLSE